MRSIEMHSWPVLAKQPTVAPSTARSRSTSAVTIMAFLPPSSAEKPMSRSPAWPATVRPVAVEPVNIT